MSAGDFYVKDQYQNSLPVGTWTTKASSTAINPGEPVKVEANGSNYVIGVADAEPVIGVSGSMVGLAVKAGTHTSTAAGTVNVQYFMPGTVYAGKSKTSTDANTDAKIIALMGKHVVLDLTAGVYTVDSAAAEAANNGILIVGGDSATSVIYFMVRPGATIFGNVL